MEPTKYVQISTDIGLAGLGTLLGTVAFITWWFSTQLKKITDNQSSTQASLTKSINDVNSSQEKRDNDLDRNVAAVQSALTAHSSLIEQKMTTLQEQMTDVSNQLKENRHDTNELRERVVRVETILKMEAR